MTDAQSRERFEKWFSEDRPNCRSLERSAEGGYKLMQATIQWEAWQAALSHPAPQRDEHITRILNHLKGGIGMFLQEDGVGLSEYVRGLEDNSTRTQALYDVLNNMCVRTATTYPGKTETFAEAVQWMRENVLDDLVSKQNEINRQVHRACMAENELADLKCQLAERDAEVVQLRTDLSEMSSAWDAAIHGEES